MKVSNILDEKGRDVMTVPPSATLDEAITLFNTHKIGSVVVLGDNKKILGVFSERELVGALATHGTDVLKDQVGNHMNANLISCVEEDEVTYLMETMTNGRFRHVPVVEEGELKGIVSLGDVVKARLKQAETEAEAMRHYISAV